MSPRPRRSQTADPRGIRQDRRKALAASVATQRTPEQRAAMAAATIGAQVILDYNGDGSIGARGGAGATIEENTMARDAHLIGLGLDPNAPSGPPTGVPWEPPPPPNAARHVRRRPPRPHACRASRRVF